MGGIVAGITPLSWSYDTTGVSMLGLGYRTPQTSSRSAGSNQFHTVWTGVHGHVPPRTLHVAAPYIL